MSEQWTTVIHDASEAPLKDGGYFIEISYPSGIIDWTAGQFDSKNKRWYSKEDMSFVPISRWCEKPPVQKKKTKKIIELHVWRAESESGYIADTISMNRPIPYLGKFPIEIEE